MTDNPENGSTGVMETLIVVSGIAVVGAVGWWGLSGGATHDDTAETREPTDATSTTGSTEKQPETSDTRSAPSDTGRDTAAPSPDTESADTSVADGRPSVAETAQSAPSWATGDGALRDRLASLNVGPDSDLRLTIAAKTIEGHHSCDRGANLEFHLKRNGNTVDSHTFRGTCEGACTPEEKREGRERLDELKRRIDAGKADPSQLDYNFTDCIELEHRIAHTFEAPTPPLVVVVSDTLGPHSTVEKRARLVTVGCEAIQTSPELDNPRWPNYTQNFSRMNVATSRTGSTRRYEMTLPDSSAGPGADGGYPMTARVEVTFDEATCEWSGF